jgi:hypothetical protein
VLIEVKYEDCQLAALPASPQKQTWPWTSDRHAGIDFSHFTILSTTKNPSKSRKTVSLDVGRQIVLRDRCLGEGCANPTPSLCCNSKLLIPLLKTNFKASLSIIAIHHWLSCRNIHNQDLTIMLAAFEQEMCDCLMRR